MNYHPVTAGNQTNSGAGFKDKFDGEKSVEEVDQSYMLFLVWSSVGSINPQNNAEDAAFDGKEHDFDVKKPDSKVILSPSSSAQSKEQDDMTMKEAKGKSLIEFVTGYRDLNADVAGPSNTAVSPTYGDASQFPDDLDMPRLEDIIYYDDEGIVGAEADFNNLESSIPVSPIPTTRIYKDHPVSQIIDPSWIEAMQEELLQFKMQKVWVLVNLPYGKRAIGTKWVYKNKRDERGIVIRNKGRLVAQGHTQEDGIDYEELFAPVVKQKKDGIFISQDKYVAEILRKFRLSEEKSASTPIDAEKPLLKDSDGEDVDVHTY
nr:ribonuclease H-like domain-containing protein [Tanacetum cinerariifolium]